MSDAPKPQPAVGYLKPKGRAFMWGALSMLALVQTGGAFNWPVFDWLRDHRPSVTVTTDEQVQP